MTARLAVRDLAKSFPAPAGWLARARPPIQAVAGVSLDIPAGATLGLIGESGCGKSTLGRAILRLHEPDAGTVHLGDTDVTALDAAGLKAIRRRMQIVFQNPYASLNPSRSVADILAAPLLLHGIADRPTARREALALLDRVGLAAAHADRYPHQFSGGQRQRIAIARALILDPDFVVCDEPVSALDVSIQAQILDLLAGLRRDRGLTYLFISHDIAVIAHVADAVAVMYLGRIVESGPTRAVLRAPRHPYTRALMDAVPRLDGPRQARTRLAGDPPSPQSPPSGCRFHPRCPLATERCRAEPPPLRHHPDGRAVACHHAPETDA